MIMRPLVLVFAAALFLAATAAAFDQTSAPALISQSRAKLVEHYADIQSRCKCAGSLQTRLDAEATELSESASQPGSADQSSMLAMLEQNLIDQLISGSYRSPSDVRSAGSVLFKSSYDGSVQPAAVYLPSDYATRRNTALVILLHGADQSENALIAIPALRALADATGSIVIAPWARGEDNYSAGAIADVYDALDTAESAFRYDRRHVYLAGISAGGIELFSVGPAHPERWSAFLTIAGTMTNEQMQNVSRSFKGKQVFMVVGADDTMVKPSYVRAAAGFLNANGAESHYYEQPSADHSWQNLRPSIERAWRDMLSGVSFGTEGNETASPRPLPSQRY